MNTAIVSGSLAAVANRDGLSLAESFLNCEVVVLIDQSGSMEANDAPGGRSRYQAADDELTAIQKKHPGQVGVISFSATVKFCPGGIPDREGSTTMMDKALNFARICDGASKVVLISDGLPDDPEKTLAAASKYRHPIHTIYIGPENDRNGGRAFLQQLAAATGGQALASDAPGLLADSVQSLLLTA